MSERDDILEECAAIAEDGWLEFSSPSDIAAAIRNLKLSANTRKTKPPTPPAADIGTPRTDAEVKLRERLPATNHGVSAEFARELEREALGILKVGLFWHSEWSFAKSLADALERELATAMKRLDDGVVFPTQSRKLNS